MCIHIVGSKLYTCVITVDSNLVFILKRGFWFSAHFIDKFTDYKSDNVLLSIAHIANIKMSRFYSINQLTVDSGCERYPEGKALHTGRLWESHVNLLITFEITSNVHWPYLLSLSSKGIQEYPTIKCQAIMQ